MMLEVRTTLLGGHAGVGVVFANNELLTLAPGQTSTPGSLVLVGEPADLAKITAQDLRIDPPGAMDVTLGPRGPGGIGITFRAITTGLAVVYVRKDPVASVTIGFHKSHLGSRAVDLLANTSNGPDCRKIVAIQQILQDRIRPGQPPPIIDQRIGAFGNPNGLVCGTVAKRAGQALFGQFERTLQPYHRPISKSAEPLSWDRIQYDPRVTEAGIAQIKARLGRGIAVALGVVYSPSWALWGPNGALQAEHEGGHTIVVVGYSGDRFLYLDPFRTGSMVNYSGGFPFNSGRVCNYMGILEIDETRGRHLASKVQKPLQPFFSQLEVISGPLH